jgi:hypothetical protein
VLSVLAAASLSAQAPTVKGYLKYLPSLRATNDLGEFFGDQLLHNRLNARWDPQGRFSFQGSLRTRLIQGYTVANVPGYADFVGEDFGAVDASWVVFQENSVLLHTTTDRLFMDYDHGKWKVRLGRQRINWGINMVSNPNDLFNTYSFFDFDYEERPGTDAVRVQYFGSALSRSELAISPGRSLHESVAAMLHTFNRRGYDIQLIAGYFRNRMALGTGWAGNIRQSGFKGELTWFRDVEPVEGIRPANVVIAVSADHRFGGGTYAVLEYLYNDQRAGVPTDLQFFTQPLRADNLSFTDHQVFGNVTHPLSPVSTVGLATIVYPSERGFFLSPNWQYSMRQDLDLLLISQLFVGDRDGLLGQAGYLVAGALKWSF